MHQPAPPRLIINSAELPPAARAAVARDVLAEAFDIAALAAGPLPEHDWRFNTWHFGQSVIAECETGPLEVSRSAARIRRDQRDEYGLIMTHRGEWAGDLAGRMVRASPGSVLVLDMARAITLRGAGNAQAVLLMPRAVMQGLVPQVASQHGRVLHGPPARLLRSHVDLLMHSLSAMTAGQAGLFYTAMCDMITACLAPPDAAPAAVFPLEAVLRQVDASLADRSLTPARLAREAGLSRSSLYRLLAPEGGVEALIMRRRLARARLMLADQAVRRPIAQVAEACGFASAAHFSRAFRRAFGTTAGAARAGRSAPT